MRALLLALLLALAAPGEAQIFGSAPATSTMLCQGAPGTEPGAVTTEVVLATCTIAAGSMGANGVIRVEVTVSLNGTAGSSKLVRVRLGGIGGTAFILLNDVTSASHFGAFRGNIWNQNSASANLSYYWLITTSGIQASTTEVTGGTVNTAVSQDLVITCIKAVAADTCQLNGYTVELFPHS